MAGKFNAWVRRELAAHILANGGYYGERFTYAPLSWTVYLYNTVSSAEEAQRCLLEYGEHYVSEADAALQAPEFEAWWKENQDVLATADGWAQDAVRESLDDDEAYRTWSPESARAVCMDYTGRGADKPFDMKLVQRGRGGKHIVLTTFEGINLTAWSNRELAGVVENAEPNDQYVRHVPNVWCRQLLGMMLELDKLLTDEAALVEYRHQYGFHLTRLLEEAHA